MAKRLLDCAASEMGNFKREDWLSSIANSEGRVMATESIGIFTPWLLNISNAEFCASLGADILLLNIFDVNQPVVQGLPPVPAGETVREIKRLTGNRLVAINLEPVPDGFESEDKDNAWKIARGRIATVENAVKAADMGVDMVLLTGNPGNGVCNAAIIRTLKEMKAAVGDRLILGAGKMHASEVLSESGENIITPDDVEAFIDAGADVVLLPAPGTVPGITAEYAHMLISRIHAHNKLAMTAIGTSQEGADVETIRNIALMCKMAGADIHHIGDSAYTGMALPEDITAYSIVIRGRRHTYRRMAMSINR